MKEKIYACVWRHYGGRQIDNIWSEEEIQDNHDGRVMYEDEKATYIREDLYEDMKRIAFALSHGWEVALGAWAFQEVCYDDKGMFQWDGKGIPPINDELRQIIDEQMKTETMPAFYQQERLKQQTANSILDAIIKQQEEN